MHDGEIRIALKAELLRLHAGEHDTRIVEELGLLQGRVRVDLAVINGLTHGFEIKSAEDTLLRLPAQSTAYNSVLDRVTLVVEEVHRPHALELVPRWWGVVVASRARTGLVKLTPRRMPRPNPTVDPRAVAELLWHAETMSALRERGEARGLVGKPRAAAWDRLCETLGGEAVLALVRSSIKARQRVGADRPRSEGGAACPPCAKPPGSSVREVPAPG